MRWRTSWSGLSDPGGRLPVTMPVEWTTRRPPGHRVVPRGTARSSTRRACSSGTGTTTRTRWRRVRVRPRAQLRRRGVGGRGHHGGHGDGAAVEPRAQPGTEVVQVYRGNLGSQVPRPARELVGFVKVELEAGERQQVEVGLDAAAYRYWDVDTHGWRSDPGRYELLGGASSRDIRASAVVEWDGR